jgi:hypothetical protein
MTKQNKQKSKKGGQSLQKQSFNPNKQIAELTKLVAEMSAKDRKIRLSPVGKALFDGGNAVSQYFGMGKIFGSGAYKMSNNKWDTSSQVPVMHSDNESVTIRHREYIGDFTGTSAFTESFNLDINPGLAATFPYLSAIAGQFQEYRFKGLVFEYKTQSGMLTGSNTALGDVMMVAQYRADAPLPTNKQQVLNEMWSVSVVPSQSGFLPIECAPKENPLRIQYVRSNVLSANQDQKLYDLANFSAYTVGTPTNFLGELWCTYEVELFKPVMSVGAPGPFSGAAAHFSFTTPTTAAGFANPVTLYDDIGLTFTGNIVTFSCEVGQLYEFIYIAAGTTVSFGSNPSAYLGTATVTSVVATGNGTATYGLTWKVAILTTSPGTTPAGAGSVVSLQIANTFNTGTTASLIVVQLPSPFA